MANKVICAPLRFANIFNRGNGCPTSLTEQSRLFWVNSTMKKGYHKIQTTVDMAEVDKHSKMMDEWWDPQGAMKALHSMNQIRVPLIRDGLVQVPRHKRTITPLLGKKILDVGCGGGILSEPLARLGAEVTGVDASKELVELAEEHSAADPTLRTNQPTYCNTTIEEHCSKFDNHYDAVVASEIIEHVPDKELFVKSCVQTLKPNGRIFFTTPNRTRLSRFAGIFLAEYVFKMVPAGTHEYNKFTTPNELSFLLERNNCHIELVYGCFYSVLNNRWSFVNTQEFLFALQAVKLQ